MPKKVYELAKEYGVQSKDFVGILQQANIPIKSHMSILTDQQEKYFRNNFTVIEGKIAPKSAENAAPSKPAAAEKPAEKTPAKPAEPSAVRKEEKPAASAAKPQTDTSANQRPARQNTPAQDSRRQGNNSSSQNRTGNPNYQGRNAGTGYQGRNNPGTGTGYQGRNAGTGYQNRNSGTGYQGRNNTGTGYQGRNAGTGSRGRNNSGTGTGYQGRNAGTGYQNRNSGTGYQGRNNTGTGYQGRNAGTGSQGRNNSGTGTGYQGRNNTGTGYQNRNTGGSYSGSGNNARRGTGQNRGTSYRTTEEKPLEKPKNDRYKNRAAYSNEKSKAENTFFSDDKGYVRPNNAKKKRGTKSEYKKQKLEGWEKRATAGVEGVVVLPDFISAAELSEKILMSTGDIMKKLMEYGVMVTLNQPLDYDTVSVICEDLGIQVELEKEPDYYEELLAAHNADETLLEPRPPIVTVMGHVDHGKTSLLDAIRNTNVFEGEKGGITQKIGAYTVSVRDKQITFIDTPGHKAFTAMRARGADVTDIAVLVVAADDGVMPQTVEAIDHAKAAKVPIIVAINKMDKPGANPQRVMDDLTKYELVPEAWGGDTICVNVSAKTGMGIDDLLDNILLLAEVENYKADYSGKSIGTILEARIDKQRGVTASLLVNCGTLKTGDFIVIDTIYGKIRAMTDWTGKRVTSAEPATAVEIIGLPEVPSAGDRFFVADDEKAAKDIVTRRKDRIAIQAARAAQPKSLDDLFEHIKEEDQKEINIIIKTDVAGSMEAIKQELSGLEGNDAGIKISVIHSGVGDVSETDIMLASASKAMIIAFNVKVGADVQSQADKEGISIKTYSIIYEIMDDMNAILKGMKEPEYEEIVTGEGEVRAVYRIPDLGPIAGSYITEGSVKRSDSIRVIRGEETIFQGKIGSLKRFKDDVREVAQGYECGIGIEKFDGMLVGDKLEFSSRRLKEED